MTTTFKNDVASHAMTIENDSGVHRSVYFGKPDSNCYSFRLVTWPGHLAITGDMGSYTFARVPDMFHLFRDDVCRAYLEEKLVASCTSSGARAFDWEHFKKSLLSGFDDDDTDNRAAVVELLDQCREQDEHEAVELARNWPDDAPYVEWCDMGNAFAGKPTYHFLWCLEAIVWGIAQYDAAKVAQEQNEYTGVEVEGCVDLGEHIERADHCGKEPEFWTVYTRDKEGFASAVMDADTKEKAVHWAQIIESGLRALGKL